MTSRVLTEEDFARAIPNPYFHGLNKKVEVYVRNDDYALFTEVAELNEETVEDAIRRVVINAANFIREHDDDE